MYPLFRHCKGLAPARSNDRLSAGLTSLIVGAVALLLAACATIPDPSIYRDPPGDEREHAIVSTYSIVNIAFPFPSIAWIWKVDDLYVSKRGPRFTQSGISYRPYLVLTAGRHHLVAVYQSMTSGEPVTFAVDVRASHGYEIRGRRDGDLVQLWLEELRDGEIAGMGSVLREAD